MGRVANAVSRPGIDPRVWLTLAVVRDVGYDVDEGIFVDVQFQPSGTIETCLLGAPYAGAEFGAYFPVNVDDTVLVAVPSGDPSTGPILIQRMWNSGDKPHADFQSEDEDEEPTQDVVLRIQPGSKLKIRTSDDGDGVEITVEGDGDALIQATGNGKVLIQATGDGNIVVQATGDGKVFLGGTSGTEPIPLATTLKNFLTSVRNDVNTALVFLQTHVHLAMGPTSLTGAPLGGAPPAPPTPANYPVPLAGVPNIEANEAEVK